jgi:autotransporter-associated beta strand protein
MLPTWLRKLTNPKSYASGRGRHTPARSKPSCRLQLEQLEDRVTPAVHTWLGSGYGTGQLWSYDSNWKEGTSPAGDPAADLVFPTAVEEWLKNDLVGLKVHSITFNDDQFDAVGYAIGGNGITLTGDITDNAPALNWYHQSLTNTIAFPVALTTTYFGSHSVSVATGTTLMVSGDITGTASLSKAGAGTLALNGYSHYSGYTDITAGTVLLGPNGNLSSVSAVTVEAGATLDLNNGMQVIGSLEGAGNVKLESGTLWTGGNNSDTTFSGIISGAQGELIKQGQGTFTLSNHNTYTGTTYVSDGTLRLGIDNAISAASAVLLGGTLDLNGFSAWVWSLSSGGGVNPKVNLGSGTLSVTGSASTTFSGVISGTNGQLSKGGPGTLTLSGNNTYTGGTAVNGGTLLVTGSLAASGSVSVGAHANGTLGGTGTVGAVLVYGYGNIDPGVSGSGTLHCSSAVFNAGSTFTAHMGSQLSATGTVDLSGSPTLLGPVGFFATYYSASIIQASAVSGTFNNTYFFNGNTYLSVAGEVFLVQYTPAGVVLTRIS